MPSDRFPASASGGFSAAETASAQRVPGLTAMFSVSDPLATGPLHRRLCAIPDAAVTRERGGPGSGQLGVVEVLQLVVPSSAVLAVAIRTIPDFIRSRRGKVEVTVEREGRSVKVTAENTADIEGIIRRLLNDD